MAGICTPTKAANDVTVNGAVSGLAQLPPLGEVSKELGLHVAMLCELPAVQWVGGTDVSLTDRIAIVSQPSITDFQRVIKCSSPAIDMA